MNFYKHHLGDYAQATAHLTFVEDAAYSRLLRKYYADERPIPADLKAAQRLVAARTKEEREAVETVLAEFFELRKDGWHNKRCDEELAKAQEQAETNRRIAEEREARKRARIEHEALHESSGERATNRSTNRQPSHKPLATSQTPEEKAETEARSVSLASASDLAEAPADPPAATPVALACIAMRQAGAIRVNPSHPKLLAGLAEGGTPAMYGDAVREAIEAGKGEPFAYAIATVRSRLREAARPLPEPSARAGPAQPSKSLRAIQKLREVADRDRQPPTVAQGRIEHRPDEADLPAATGPATG